MVVRHIGADCNEFRDSKKMLELDNLYFEILDWIRISPTESYFYKWDINKYQSKKTEF